MFLCQVRKNGNVIRTAKPTDHKEVAGFLKELAKFFEDHQDPELLKQLHISIQEDDGVKRQQYQAVVLVSLRDDQAEADGVIELADLKDWIDQAVHVTLDEEHENPFGVTPPMLLIDTLMPLAFDLPNVDPLQVCYYFRRRGYEPYALCTYRGEDKELISFPFATDTGICIMVRTKDGIDAVMADLLEVKLKG